MLINKYSAIVCFCCEIVLKLNRKDPQKQQLVFRLEKYVAFILQIIS